MQTTLDLLDHGEVFDLAIGVFFITEAVVHKS